MKLGTRIGVPYGTGEKPTVYTADVSDFTVQGNGSINTSTVTGNGHIGNAKRIEHTGANTAVAGLTYTLPVEIVSDSGVGKKVRISFLYRYYDTNNNAKLDLGNGSAAATNFQDLPQVSGNAVRYIKEDIWTYSDANAYDADGERKRVTIMWVNADTEFLEISDFSIAVY